MATFRTWLPRDVGSVCRNLIQPGLDAKSLLHYSEPLPGLEVVYGSLRGACNPQFREIELLALRGVQDTPPPLL